MSLSTEKIAYNFDDIRPFYDNEVGDALVKVIEDPYFMKLVNYLWPSMSIEEVREKTARVDSCFQFQLEFMNAAIHKIVEMSSVGLSTSGFDKLEKGKSYLFVANHRDIFLDAAILQIVLVDHGFPTSEISFGSNLKEEGFITAFGKLNRMFTVIREGSSKELYEISRKLSSYIRHTITEKKVSVWIAQRNGRTKDGIDLTQTGLLKMLNFSGEGDVAKNFSDLNIVPICITYEYEPCDFLKTQELYLSNLHAKYVKAPGEDLNSIITGIRQNKGRIHLAAGPMIKADVIVDLFKGQSDNDGFRLLASEIDSRINSYYQRYPVHYIAADLLQNSTVWSEYYSPIDKKAFEKYMQEGLAQLKGEPEALRQVFLKMYAAAVINP
jgi:hypothetical protein